MDFKGKFDPPLELPGRSTAQVRISGDTYTATIVSNETGKVLKTVTGKVVNQEEGKHQ
jgi:hypothetical protein